MPNPASPQNFNRFGYVGNRPIIFVDPSGHEPKYGCYSSDAKGNCLNANGTTLMLGNGRGGKKPICSSSVCNSDPTTSSEYVGPIPDAIIDIMVSQGADADFLASVTIYRAQDDELNSHCRPNAAAVTWYNTIYYCNLDIKYYNPNVPTPVLLHELIHVLQFQNYEEEILDELAWISALKARDKFIEIWNNQSQFVQNHDAFRIDIGKFDPYTYSWVEVQGKQCQLAFAANPNIPLDRTPCNIVP